MHFLATVNSVYFIRQPEFSNSFYDIKLTKTVNKI